MPIHVPALLVAGLIQQAVPSITELVTKLHAPRQGITRYELIIDARQAEGKDAKPHVVQVWRDGARYRTDRRDQFDGRGLSRRFIECTNCPEPGKFFTVAYDHEFDRSKAAALGSLSNRKDLTGDRLLRLDDFGATDEEVVNLALRGLQWHISLDDWTEKRVERCRWKDLPAYKMVLSVPKPLMSLEVTFLPGRGFAAVDARSVSEEGDDRMTTSTESELTQVSGIWLPKTCIYKKFINGKLTEGYVQKIEYVSVDKPLDPRVFTPEAMDLIPGTLVRVDGKTLNWDGQKLGPATELSYGDPETSPPEAAARKSGTRRVILLALAGGAVLACGFFVRRLVWSSRSGRAQGGPDARPPVAGEVVGVEPEVHPYGDRAPR